MKRIIVLFLLLLFFVGISPAYGIETCSANSTISSTAEIDESSEKSSKPIDAEMWGVIIAGVALVGTLLYNIIIYSNYTPIEMALIPIKDRNLAIFIQITMLIIAVSLSFIILIYTISVREFFKSIIAGAYTLFNSVILILVANTPNVYLFDKESKTLYRIKSRIDEEHLFTDILNTKGFGRKIIHISLVEKNQIYTSRKNLMDKSYDEDKIKKILKINQENRNE